MAVFVQHSFANINYNTTPMQYTVILNIDCGNEYLDLIDYKRSHVYDKKTEWRYTFFLEKEKEKRKK